MSLLPAPTKLFQSNGSLQHAAAGAAIRVHARHLRQFHAKSRSILLTDDPTIKDGLGLVGAGDVIRRRFEANHEFISAGFLQRF